MLVTLSSDSSVLDTENGDIYIRSQCVIIRFLHLRGMKPIEIHQQLSETCNDGVMDVKNGVRGYDSSKKAERRVKTNRSSLGHALDDLKT
jgi:hypothetical protein